MGGEKPTIAVVGGTGALGGGLAYRLGGAGYEVILGSRSSEKAKGAAAKLMGGGMPGKISGMDNKSAAEKGGVIIVTVPFSNQAAILEEISGCVIDKIVVDATVPLALPKVGRVKLPEIGCAALIAQEILGTEIAVVSAFHNVAASKLYSGGVIDCDVLVFGDLGAARRKIVDLIEAIGMRGIHGGPLANSAAAEAMTSVLITINKRYKVPNAGIRITGDLVDPQSG